MVCTHKKIRKRYQDMDADKKEEQHSQDEQSYQQEVNEIFDDLLAKADYVPGLAIRYCCVDGKTLTLAKILETFPCVATDGRATRHNERVDEADDGDMTYL